MATDTDGALKAPPIIERFLRQLVVTNKAVGLYPPSSNIPRDTAEDCVAILNEALTVYSEVALSVTKQDLLFDEIPVFAGQQAFSNFALELYHRRLAAVRFHAGVTYRDIIAFLTVITYTPEDVAAGGGFEAMLWDQGVGAITVVETQVALVDAAPAEGEDQEEKAPPAPEPLSAMVRKARKPQRQVHSRERIELVRMAGDQTKVRDYLTNRRDFGGTDLSLAGTARRFSEVARLAAESNEEEAASLLKSIADALWTLEPKLRHDLLVNEVLPEARVSTSLANALRNMDLEEICRMLTEGGDPGDPRREGLARALRNLAQITHTSREGMLHAASRPLHEAGLDGSDAEALIERALPTRIAVRRAPIAARSLDTPAAVVLQLIDEAPVSQAELDSDPDVLRLRAEALAGISDRDVVATLVLLVGLDTRDAQFASTMSSLEDLLDILVAKGQIEVAAEAALSLLDAAKNPKLDADQKRRLEDAVRRFARPDDIRAIVKAMRQSKPGEPEHDAARRLLDSLGAVAYPPLLEQLAEEPDRMERKSLIDLLSRDAVKYIPELGEQVSDPRWFFVRNVIGILASTKSSAILPYLERTLRQPDARVRRETVRALSSVGDRRALEMLVQALTDDDAQNVQLAARYLGLRGTASAIPALEQVAKGEGRGNRENGPKIEAIEALGKLGAVQALPTLQALATKRSLIGSSRVREIKTAAAAAIAVISAKGGVS